MTLLIGLVEHIAEATMKRAPDGDLCILGVQNINGSECCFSLITSPNFLHTAMLSLIISFGLMLENLYVSDGVFNIPSSLIVLSI